MNEEYKIRRQVLWDEIDLSDATLSDFPASAEFIRDTIGTALTDSSTIDFTVDDGGDTITAAVKDNSLVVGKLTFTATDKLAGRSTSGAGAGEEITCTSAGRAILDDADAAAQRDTLGILAFKTIAVSGQSDVVADADDDTLTIAAGSGITITTDASTDTVTIAGSAALTVKESDGSPSVSNVDTIAFDGATVTDNGNGDVTVTISAGAGANVTVEEIVASTAFPAANNVDILNIPSTYAKLILIVSGASSNTASRALLVQVSTNNGSSWATTNYIGLVENAAGTLTTVTGNISTPANLQAAADTHSFVCNIQGYQGGGGCIAHTAGAQSYANGSYMCLSAYVGSTSAINALRLIWNGTGNFDGGTYKLLGVTAGGAGTIHRHTCDLRLTLTSSTPVTTSDVTAATTLYATPYKGNQVGLFDGSDWQLKEVSELSIAVPATTNTMYDVWLDYNGGTPQLVLDAWTNDTTRATALTTQDGIYVKTGATDHRYLGSFRTTGTSGQTEDSVTKRFVWNYYNRVKKKVKVVEATNSWSYSDATWRQANASTANQVAIVQGVAEDTIDLIVRGAAINSTSSGRGPMAVGIGVDSTTASSADIMQTSNCNNSILATPSAQYVAVPTAGYHFYAWLEYAESSADTQTWLGDDGNAARSQFGLIGHCFG